MRKQFSAVFLNEFKVHWSQLTMHRIHFFFLLPLRHCVDPIFISSLPQQLRNDTQSKKYCRRVKMSRRRWWLIPILCGYRNEEETYMCVGFLMTTFAFHFFPSKKKKDEIALVQHILATRFGFFFSFFLAKTHFPKLFVRTWKFPVPCQYSRWERVRDCLHAATNLFLDQNISCCCFKYSHISKSMRKEHFWRFFFFSFQVSINFSYKNWHLWHAQKRTTKLSAFFEKQKRFFEIFELSSNQISHQEILTFECLQMSSILFWSNLSRVFDFISSYLFLKNPDFWITECRQTFKL